MHLLADRGLSSRRRSRCPAVSSRRRSSMSPAPGPSSPRGKRRPPTPVSTPCLGVDAGLARRTRPRGSRGSGQMADRVRWVCAGRPTRRVGLPTTGVAGPNPKTDDRRAPCSWESRSASSVEAIASTSTATGPRSPPQRSKPPSRQSWLSSAPADAGSARGTRGHPVAMLGPSGRTVSRRELRCARRRPGARGSGGHSPVTSRALAASSAAETSVSRSARHSRLARGSRSTAPSAGWPGRRSGAEEPVDRGLVERRARRRVVGGDAAPHLLEAFAEAAPERLDEVMPDAGSRPYARSRGLGQP